MSFRPQRICAEVRNRPEPQIATAILSDCGSREFEKCFCPQNSELSCTKTLNFHWMQTGTSTVRLVPLPRLEGDQWIPCRVWFSVAQRSGARWERSSSARWVRSSIRTWECQAAVWEAPGVLDDRWRAKGLRSAQRRPLVAVAEGAAGDRRAGGGDDGDRANAAAGSAVRVSDGGGWRVRGARHA